MRLPFQSGRDRSDTRLLGVCGGLRVLFGLAILARPTAVARVLGVDSVTARRTDWLARMVGVRDLALGVGALSAAGNRIRPHPGRWWLVGQAASDATDAAVVLRAAAGGYLSWPRAAAAAGLAVSGVLGELAGLRAVRER